MSETAEKPQSGGEFKLVVESSGMALGAGSTVCGIISIFFMAFIFSPLALILGVIGVLRRQYLLSIIGIATGLLGLATSPMVWAFLGLSAIAAR